MATNTLPQSDFLDESDKDFLNYLQALRDVKSADVAVQKFEKKHPKFKKFITGIKPITKNLLNALRIDPERTEKLNQMKIRGEISEEQLVESMQPIVDGGVK